MNKVINIRGSNACGKSTCVREFIKKYPDAAIEKFEVNNKLLDITVMNKRKIVVLGRYDVSTGGADRYGGKEIVISIILKLIAEIKPEVIIYEGVLLGVTFKMSYEIHKMLLNYGYEYIGIYLYRDFKQQIALLEQRNGGKDYDISRVYNKYMTAWRSYKRLKANKVHMIKVDVDGYSIPEMGRIIEKEIEK